MSLKQFEERPIEYWRDLYLVHANTSAFQRKVEKSKNIIEEFLSIGAKSYSSLSGGKDSTAMTHLIASVNKDVQIVSQKDDMDFPGEKEFVKMIAGICNMGISVIEPKESLWDILESFDFTEDVHSSGTDFSERFFYGVLRAHQKEKNYKGAFLGLRAEESKGRAMNAKVNRYIYYNLSWGQLICQPIIEWSAKDVFGYLFKHNLPILPLYFQTKFVGSPEKIRKSWVLPSAQSSQGQATWLKYYYPEIFNRLAKINPKIRCYV